MLALIYFILILGLIVFIHELGHFIFAKKAGVHCYEFSLGMGPKIYSFRRKNDETTYSIRAFPIGGFVQMAGEEIDCDDDIPKEKRMQSKTTWQRFKIVVAGAFNNFLLGLFLLFLMALIYGSISTKPIIANVSPEYPAYTAGIREGDKILSVDGNKVSSWSEVQLYIASSKGNDISFVLKDKDGNKRTVIVKPNTIEDKDGNKSYVVGIGIDNTVRRGFVSSITYAGETTVSLYKLMLTTIKQLFTGGVSAKDLSGPVGIYSIVDSQAKQGFQNIMYLTAYLSMNVGVINLLPFPAFDGGRVLFLIIEKIRRKPVPAKTEAMVNSIGFMLLMLLMVYVTFNDILRLF